MKPAKSPDELLDMYFNDLRSHFLEAAATLDRLDRAGIAQSAAGRRKLDTLLAAASVLSEKQLGRAERFLTALSEK